MALVWYSGSIGSRETYAAKSISTSHTGHIISCERNDLESYVLLAAQVRLSVSDRCDREQRQYVTMFLCSVQLFDLDEARGQLVASLDTRRGSADGR